MFSTGAIRYTLSKVFTINLVYQVQKEMDYNVAVFSELVSGWMLPWIVAKFMRAAQFDFNDPGINFKRLCSNSS